MTSNSCSNFHNDNNKDNALIKAFRFIDLCPMTRQSILEEAFERKIRDGESLRDIRKQLNAVHGPKFISNGGIHRRFQKFLKDPDSAGLNGTRFNKGKPKELQGAEKIAWQVISAYVCKYETTFTEGLRYLGKVARFLHIPRSKFPTIHQCRYRWSKEDPDVRLAIIGDEKSAFSKAEAYTHRPDLEPDELHMVDEGEYTLFSWEKKQKAKIYYSRQVDVATGIVRATHFSRNRFTERDVLLQLKKGSQKDPSRGLPYNCLPKCVRLDMATPHRTLSIERVNYLLRNREGRRGRIQINPGETPRANSNVERNIGETKRKPLKTIKKDFERFMKTRRVPKPVFHNSMAFVEGIENEFREFDNWHNHAVRALSKQTRMDLYRNNVPAESLQITQEEIDELFYFYRKLPFTGHGVDVDGVVYDSDEDLRKYRGKKAWIGVPPEHSEDEPAEFAYLAVTDPESIFKIVAKLTMPRRDKKMSGRKLKTWRKVYREGRNKIKARAAIIDALDEQHPPKFEMGKTEAKRAKRKARATIPKKRASAPPRKSAIKPKRHKLDVSRAK